MKTAPDTYLSRDLSQLLLIDHQPSMAAAVRSMDRQLLESNTLALARAADDFGVPVTLTVLDSTPDAARFYRESADDRAGHATVARTSIDVWDDVGLMAALAVQARRQLVLSGLWTEGSVCWSAISAIRGANYSVYVVTDACGGTTAQAHAAACRRMDQAGAHLVTLRQVQRGWQREPARPVSVLATRIAGGGVDAPRPGSD